MPESVGGICAGFMSLNQKAAIFPPFRNGPVLPLD